MWNRLSPLAIGEMVATVIIGFFAISFGYSAYKNFFLHRYLQKGLLYYTTGGENFEDALTNLDKVQEIDPHSPDLHNLYGAIFANSQKLRLKKAKQHFEKAERFSRSLSDKYFAKIGLAICALYEAERADTKSKARIALTSAEEELDQASALQGKNLRDDLVYSWIVKSLKSSPDVAKGTAKEILDLLSEGGINSPLPSREALAAFYYRYGQILLALGKAKEGCQYLRAAYRVYPFEPKISQEIIRALHMLIYQGLDKLEGKNAKQIERKLKDLIFVEHVLTLSPSQKLKGNLLGLESAQIRLLTQMGEAYIHLAIRLGKSMDWFQEIPEVDPKLFAQLKERRLSKPIFIAERGIAYLRKAQVALQKKRKFNKPELVQAHVRIAESFCSLAEVLPDKSRGRELYKHAGKTYTSIAKKGVMDNSIRSQLFANAAYCYMRGRDESNAQYAARQSLHFDKTNPTAYISLGVCFERWIETRRAYRRKWIGLARRAYYQAIKALKKGIDEEVKYSLFPSPEELLTQLEEKVQQLKRMR